MKKRRRLTVEEENMLAIIIAETKEETLFRLEQEMSAARKEEEEKEIDLSIADICSTLMEYLETLTEGEFQELHPILTTDEPDIVLRQSDFDSENMRYDRTQKVK